MPIVALRLVSLVLGPVLAALRIVERYRFDRAERWRYVSNETHARINRL